jgi:hypothetical protein
MRPSGARAIAVGLARPPMEVSANPAGKVAARAAETRKAKIVINKHPRTNLRIKIS